MSIKNIKVKNMDISVDFDGTLDRADVEDYVAELIALGYNVHILTSREPCDDSEIQLIDNSDLFDIANQLGIIRENILFTSFSPKYIALKNSGMLLHLDDMETELNEIAKYTCVTAINVNKNDFRERCDRKLGIY